MLYLLLASLTDEFSPFNVFRYQTTRTGAAILTALLFVFLFGPRIISLLKVKQGRGQPIRAPEYTDEKDIVTGMHRDVVGLDQLPLERRLVSVEGAAHGDTRRLMPPPAGVLDGREQTGAEDSDGPAEAGRVVRPAEAGLYVAPIVEASFCGTTVGNEPD